MGRGNRRICSKRFFMEFRQGKSVENLGDEPDTSKREVLAVPKKGDSGMRPERNKGKRHSHHGRGAIDVENIYIAADRLGNALEW